MWVVMILNEREKEALMIELLNKGIPVREIAKKAHVSFTYIKKTRAKITGKADEDNKPLSLSSQAFKLFLGGKSLVEVAISLDIQPEQVIKIHKDYLTLQNASRFVSILNRHGEASRPF
jgi:hypothetical protein